MRAVVTAEEGYRNEGYTFVDETEFANLDDMKYNMDDCPAQGKAKKVLGETVITGIMSVFFNPEIPEALSNGNIFFGRRDNCGRLCLASRTP